MNLKQFTKRFKGRTVLPVNDSEGKPYAYFTQTIVKPEDSNFRAACGDFFMNSKDFTPGKTYKLRAILMGKKLMFTKDEMPE